MASLRRSVIVSILFVVFGGPAFALVYIPFWITRFRVPAGEPAWQVDFGLCADRGWSFPRLRVDETVRQHWSRNADAGGADRTSCRERNVPVCAQPHVRRPAACDVRRGFAVSQPRADCGCGSLLAFKPR